MKHCPVMLKESVSALVTAPDGFYIDATFGRGGHSRAILEKLNDKGRLLALDRDPEAIAAALEINDWRFKALHAEFSQMGEVAPQQGFKNVDGILIDLGVSSPQIDNAQRGFSFQADGPLDMRMNPETGESAAQWLARASLNDIREVLKNYGQERFAFKIAKAIISFRAERPLTRTGQLAQIIRQSVPKFEPGQDAATRSFQAIRIFINEELRELEKVLPIAFQLLKKGGRLAVIAFHSLEDGIVKAFFNRLAKPENAIPSLVPLSNHELPQPQLRLIGKKIKASVDEVLNNPRSRSAILRVAEKC